MRYIIAIVVCFTIELVFQIFGVAVFGWKHGGGVIPQLFVSIIVVCTFAFIVKKNPTGRVSGGKQSHESSQLNIATTSSKKEIPMQGKTSLPQQKTTNVTATDLTPQIHISENLPESKSNKASDFCPSTQIPIEKNDLHISSESPEDSSLNINDDRIYEKALEEIENNKPHKASWARAFSEAEGDEVKTKALYIKLRVANIKDKLRQGEEKRQAEARRIQDLREQELRRLQAAKKKEEVLDDLGDKLSNLLHRHEKVLAAYDLTDYIYDITKLTSPYKRVDFARWLMHCDGHWFLRTITAGPTESAFGHYGIILLIALEKGIGIQGAKKWGRPSRFKVLDTPSQME